MTTTQHITGTNWKARLSEANDAIGAARDAMNRAKNWDERKAAEKDLTFWLQQKAHAEGWLVNRPSVTRFTAQVCVPLMSKTAGRFDTEAEALAFAREQVGPNQSQVSIDAWTKDYGQTFAVRHLTWQDGEVRDSGWRRWLAGNFIGVGDLDFS